MPKLLPADERIHTFVPVQCVLVTGCCPPSTPEHLFATVQGVDVRHLSDEALERARRSWVMAGASRALTGTEGADLVAEIQVLRSRLRAIRTEVERLRRLAHAAPDRDVR